MMFISWRVSLSIGIYNNACMFAIGLSWLTGDVNFGLARKGYIDLEKQRQESIERNAKRLGIAAINYQANNLSLSITNENGWHTHDRNGEHFRGKRATCPLCKTGSEFEKAMGAIGA